MPSLPEYDELALQKVTLEELGNQRSLIEEANIRYTDGVWYAADKDTYSRMQAAILAMETDGVASIRLSPANTFVLPEFKALYEYLILESSRRVLLVYDQEIVFSEMVGTLTMRDIQIENWGLPDHMQGALPAMSTALSFPDVSKASMSFRNR